MTDSMYSQIQGLVENELARTAFDTEEGKAKLKLKTIIENALEIYVDKKFIGKYQIDIWKDANILNAILKEKGKYGQSCSWSVKLG
jgi:hypothetical protein